MKNCNNCNLIYEDEKLFCIECGATLEKENIIKYCDKCNLEYDIDKRFCKECGTTLTEKSVKTNIAEIKNNEEIKKELLVQKVITNTNKFRPNRKRILVFLFSIIFILVAASVYFLIFNSNGEVLINNQISINPVTNEKEIFSSYIFTEPKTKMKFVELKGGNYISGDVPSNFTWAKKEFHIKTFWIGMYEVTERNWKDIFPDWENNPSLDDFPISNISWDKIQEFLKELNSKTGRNFRLPTDEEWEFAARSGGKNYNFPNGKNDITCDEACFDRNNLESECTSEYNKFKKEPVGSYPPPKYLPIYDMAGNVSELCSDNFTSLGEYKITRGGSYLSPKHECSVFWKGGPGFSILKSNPGDDLGFRLVLDEPNLLNEFGIQRMNN